MIKSASLTLNTRLREALRNGCAYIEWAEIHEWYAMDRITNSVREDLIERWTDLQEEYANFSMPRFKLAAASGRLLIVENGDDGFWIFGARRVKDFKTNADAGLDKEEVSDE